MLQVSFSDYCSLTTNNFRLHLFFQGFKIRSCVLNSQMPANNRSHIINEFNEGKFKYIIASDSRDAFGSGQGDNEEAAGVSV
jgi:ATP-dependent RNA helicase DDX56/DBP9